MKNLTKKTEELNKYLKANLSSERYWHSVRVGQYAAYLASLSKKTKKLKNLAYFTGLVHDICKEVNDETMLKIVKKDDKPISDVELQRVNLLHGRAGAVVLYEKFNIKDQDVLLAVKCHTFGSPKLTKLGKLVFVADKIEPGRAGKQDFRKMAKKVSLDELTLEIVNWSIASTMARNCKVSKDTLQMQKKLKRKLKKKKR